MTSEEKAVFFKGLFEAEKEAKLLGFGTRTMKVGKAIKIVAIGLTPIFFEQGRSYAEDIYSAGPVMQTVSGAGQVFLPMGPADATATWDMTQQEVADGNRGWGALGETFFNPASPRWLPWQMTRGFAEDFWK